MNSSTLFKVGESSVARLSEAVSSSSLSVLLAAGGDKRIWPDPATGRNRYGTLTRPNDAEISFSSSTASNPSQEAFTAAGRALSDLVTSPTASVDRWFEAIHATILQVLDCSQARTILAASGTDAELLSLGILSALSPRPLSNLFVAPDETGNGVPQAAAGLHFASETALGRDVMAGSKIAGLGLDRIKAYAIAIRDHTGKPRSETDIDADMIAHVERELRKGRDVIVHVLDTSKTGLNGVARNAARYAANLHPGRVRVVIDACQLRGPLEHIKDDIADGFIVLATASKFFSAPPFAGVILLPPAVVDALPRARLPKGLSDYTAAQDWSCGIRENSDVAFGAEMNLGLGLRWVAGLHNIAGYAAIGKDARQAIREAYVNLVRQRSSTSRGYYIHADDDGPHLASRAIVSLTVKAEQGLALERARHIQKRLRDSGDCVCHVGQPVTIGPRAVLRVSLSAVHMIAIAQRLILGQSFATALLPLANDLDRMFSKWDSLRDV